MQFEFTLRRKIMKLVRIVLCAAMLAAAFPAMSQTRSGSVIVDVPFAFVVNGQTLPAGHYIVTATGDYNIRISSQEAGVNLITHSAWRRDSNGTKLVFHRYEDTYFLSAVWVTGYTTGRELARSRAEHDLADHKTEMELAVVRPGKLPSEK
jgi:hypothetical protein